jgi:hypothetical protein
MKGKPSKTADPVVNVRVLKVGTCPTLSGRSQLTYHLGASSDSEIHLRIHANSGHGCFGRDWVSLRTLQQALAKSSGPITSGSLQKVFAGKSQNTSGFVLAALFHEGLLKPMRDTRGYEATDGAEFMREVKRLLDKGPTHAVTEDAPKKNDAAKAAPKKAGAPMPMAKKTEAPSKAKTARR